MKTKSSLLFIFSFAINFCFSQNPFITHIYTADPSAHVFNDTLYVYPSHDKEDAHWFNMSDWHVFSTTDMKHWTDHGIALSLDSLPWATQYAWAPDCAFRNGKYYFYFPTDKKYIGVATSEKPYGPFKDAIGKPLITRQTPGVKTGRGLIDPCIFMDDDSTAYLVFGQSTVNIVKLNSDMVSFSDTVQIIKGARHFFEAAWMHKYNGNYYLSYSGKGKILYAMSKSPYGPFEYKGVILDKVNSGTNHASIVEYKNHWYLFYHNSDLYFTNHPGARKKTIKRWYRRSICVDEMHYNADGTIQKVIPTTSGVKQSDNVFR
jgi:beta-xylosidase